MTSVVVNVSEPAVKSGVALIEWLKVLGPIIVGFGAVIFNSYYDRKQERRQNKGRSYELLLSKIDDTAEALMKSPIASEEYINLSTKSAIVNIWASKEVYTKTEELIDSIFDVHNYLVDYYNLDIIREQNEANAELKELREKYATRYNALVQQMRKELNTGEGAPMTFSKRGLKKLNDNNFYVQIKND